MIAIYIILFAISIIQISSIPKHSTHSSITRLTNFNRNVSSRLLNIRGGAKDTKSESNSADDAEDDFIVEDSNETDIAEEEALGGQGRQLFASIRDIWNKTPPMTQIYIGSSILLTLVVWVLNNNKWPKILNLEWSAVLTKLQIWRPLTAFLFFGPFGINYLLTIHFVWTYMAQLEKLNYNKPEDFLILIVFGAASLLIGYTFLGLSTKFLGHNLSTYLVYIWARTFEGSEVSVMDLFVLKAELLPWFFCLQTLILEGEMPFADMLGIVVGHLYYYLSQRKLLVAPNLIKNLFSSEQLQERYKKFKDDFE